MLKYFITRRSKVAHIMHEDRQVWVSLCNVVVTCNDDDLQDGLQGRRACTICLSVQIAKQHVRDDKTPAQRRKHTRELEALRRWNEGKPIPGK